MEGVDKDWDVRLGEGGRVGAMENSTEFVTHDFVGETREAITFVI